VQGKVETNLNEVKGTFNLDRIQRWLLMANDLPGMKVTAQLAHSSAPITNLEDASGALDLDVTISRRPEDVIAAVQNTSSESLGPWSGIARVDFNSFTALGERTTVIGYSTIGKFEQEVIQGLEQVRVGNSGLWMGASLAYGHSAPGGDLAQLNLKGDSIVGTIEADYPWIRLRRHSLTLAAGMDFINQKMNFPGGGVLSDDDLRIIWARAQGDALQELFDNASGRLTATSRLTVDLRKGIQGIGSSQAGDPTLSRVEGHPDALVLRGDDDTTLRFEPARSNMGIALEAHVMAQWSDDPLLAYEELAVGNLTIGRGYDPDAISGDRVIAAEFKGEVGPFSITPQFALAPYGFYDVAYVNNLDAGSVNRTVRSIGAGAEVRLPYHLRADDYWAKTLDKTFAAATTRPPARVLAQIIFAY
jgi:hemolysin activation/secretion protein